MNDFDRPSELIFELAKAVVSTMRAINPIWREAFVRMHAGDGFFEVKCSYALPDRVEILDVLSHKSFISQARHIGLELREKSPHPSGPVWLSILRVGSDLTYDMQYEYSDPNRWHISKLCGGAGRPEGYYVPA